ncbi:hypothetical protein [Aeromicrobium sp. P5_D10]
MSAELWILTATAVLAVVAISAALIAVRAARQTARSIHDQSAPSTALARIDRDDISPSVVHVPAKLDVRLEPRVIEGRLIVPPTQQQVVRTALGRPGVRLSVFAHGVAHALRAESRDRITALMRREYRRRRRERLQAGRKAVRSAQPSAPGDDWLGS